MGLQFLELVFCVFKNFEPFEFGFWGDFLLEFFHKTVKVQVLECFQFCADFFQRECLFYDFEEIAGFFFAAFR